MLPFLSVAILFRSLKVLPRHKSRNLFKNGSCAAWAGGEQAQISAEEDFKKKIGKEIFF